MIPDDVKQNHGELLEMILASESMNNEERQYWINILPIMTPDQVENLRSILVNERDQLAAIDAKYAGNKAPSAPTRSPEETAKVIRERRESRELQEQTAEEKEEEAAAALLAQIESF